MEYSSEFAAIIMAGGLGKRMNSTLPKVLHTISDEPMIVRIIKEVHLIHPKKIYIVVGIYKSIIQSTIESYIDLAAYSIHFVLQEQALGTGHAIQCCVNELSTYSDNTNVLILSGDVPLLKKETMCELLKKHNQVKMMVTHLEDPTGYGRILENIDIGSVKIIEEKDCSPEEKRISKVNCGIYAFEKSILCQYIVQLSNDNSQKEYYLTDIIKIIQENENISIGLLEIPLENQYEILGVNNVEQLVHLQKRMNIV
jgi:UDP-N-acetylglucosamine diphosphorylase/glucosamine-1-phosphate N-acetyltransferase